MLSTYKFIITANYTFVLEGPHWEIENNMYCGHATIWTNTAWVTPNAHPKDKNVQVCIPISSIEFIKK